MASKKIVINRDDTKNTLKTLRKAELAEINARYDMYDAKATAALEALRDL